MGCNPLLVVEPLDVFSLFFDIPRMTSPIYCFAVIVGARRIGVFRKQWATRKIPKFCFAVETTTKAILLADMRRATSRTRLLRIRLSLPLSTKSILALTAMPPCRSFKAMTKTCRNCIKPFKIVRMHRYALHPMVPMAFASLLRSCLGQLALALAALFLAFDHDKRAKKIRARIRRGDLFLVENRNRRRPEVLWPVSSGERNRRTVSRSG